ncbi:uncharacterized protein LOC128230445 [Mya arenaria]|uniref:uncharacterized protein LOC128230445 n=1 Tax=Mya arenaria TaxID=6604 RepID=UPI0022E798A8|nr:uncharacterized protein LOC128230445 [Mya arenaria]
MITRRKRKQDSVYRHALNDSPERFKKMKEEIKDLRFTEEPEEMIKVLDLAFVMDCTGSMSSYIEEARTNIRDIVEEIVTVENTDVRLALVEYRDHPPQESSFVTRTHDFTDSVATMKGWLDLSRANGGGDSPEAVADALDDLLNLSWQNDSIKIAVMISDAPPHGLSVPDGFPDGCPCGIDPIQTAIRLAKRDVTLYVVGCEPSITPFVDFFMALAFITGGQYVRLGRADLLMPVIVGGAQEEISLNTLSNEVERELRARREAGEDVHVEAYTRELHGRWTSRGKRVRQLQCNNVELASVSERAKQFSKLATLSDIKKVFKPQQSSGSTSGCLFGRAVGFSAPVDSSTSSYGSATIGVSFGQTSRLVQKSLSKWKT